MDSALRIEGGQTQCISATSSPNRNAPMQYRKRTRRKIRKKAETNSSIVDEVRSFLSKVTLDPMPAGFSINPVPLSETNGSVVHVKNVMKSPVRLRTIFPINSRRHGSKLPPNGIVQCGTIPVAKPTDVNLQPKSSGPQHFKENRLFSNGIVTDLGSPSTSAGKSAQPQKKVKRIRLFPVYLSEGDVQSGLLSGELIEGVIRINAKNYKEAYIKNEVPSENDYLIPNMRSRNRALEGDVVVIRLNPEAEWNETSKTATVVYIKEMVSLTF